jgi:hypothetical protein
MALETIAHIADLVVTNPDGSDQASTLDNHVRGLKVALKTDLATITGPLTAPLAALNGVGITQTFGNSSTLPASTAFVQAAVAGASAAVGLTYSDQSGTSANIINGQHMGLSNVAATTITLPAAPTAGNTVAITPLNGLTTNVIARNGLNITGLAEDMTLNDPYETVTLRYTNVAQGWRKI